MRQLGDREQELLRDLVAIDGSFLPALPRMVWAVWQDEQHRAAKMHVAFAALRQVPVGVTVTAGNRSEREQTHQLVQPGGFYVCDRGYVDYDLFAQWHALPCSFIVRVQNNAAYEVAQERRCRRRRGPPESRAMWCCSVWARPTIAPARPSPCVWCT